jgi:hypothetical protein
MPKAIKTPTTPPPPAGCLVGRLALHPRRQDRLCVVDGTRVVHSFASDQDRAAVTALLIGQGYAVQSDLTVTAACAAGGAA